MRPVDFGRDKSTESLVPDNGSGFIVDIKQPPGDDKPLADDGRFTEPWNKYERCHDSSKEAMVGYGFAAISESNDIATNSPIFHHRMMDHTLLANPAVVTSHEFQATSRLSKSVGALAKPTLRCHHDRHHGACGDHTSRSCSHLAAPSTRCRGNVGKAVGPHGGGSDSLESSHYNDVSFGGSLVALSFANFHPVPVPRQPSEDVPRCHAISDIVDLSVLGNVYFIIISIASVFIQLGYYVPFVYLADFAASLGIDPSNAAGLFVIIGMCLVSRGSLLDVLYSAAPIVVLINRLTTRLTNFVLDV